MLVYVINNNERTGDRLTTRGPRKKIFTHFQMAAKNKITAVETPCMFNTKLKN